MGSNDDIIYARSFYLDRIAAGWKALIAEDYSWVVPLTPRVKFGIRYLYQPAFTQQLGVFAKAGVAIPYTHIVERLGKRYRFWDINWNIDLSKTLGSFSPRSTAATNFLLDLSKKYDEIKEGYHKDLIKNLNRGKKNEFNYVKSDNFSAAITLFRTHYGDRTLQVTDDDYYNFEQICSYCADKGMLLLRNIQDSNGNIVAAALMLHDGKRIYNMMNTTTEAGRKLQANHYLLDSIIKEFSGQPIVFDFEGSDLPGVKEFYENFGASNRPYYQLKYNNLPWPIKLFKR